MEKTRTYIAIDLKSFYASVECMDRGLDPLDACLVVADASRTSKTICLAVSPALKSFGLPGRPRLFEVETAVERLNARRGDGSRKSSSLAELTADPKCGIDFMVATPRMATYMAVSTRIYEVYLKYIAPEDIHVYSIDEVFIDVTGYLATYGCTAHELALRMIRDVLATTGITATAGIGPNMYLAKVAMDVVAKHIPADEDGVRIAELDEFSYRERLWAHRPITDFWRVGKGIARRLASMGIKTMGDVALLSTTDEELLYKEFGVNAELLIDHAWGWEPCTMADIKSYKPSSSSLTAGQVLMGPYTYAQTRTVVREMADALALDLTAKGLVATGLTLMVGYDIDSDLSTYAGEMVQDYYGRVIPKPMVGTHRFSTATNSATELVEATLAVFDRRFNRDLLSRRINIGVNTGSAVEKSGAGAPQGVQLDLFGQVEEAQARAEQQQQLRKKDEALQEAILGVKDRFGKNALLKGTSFTDGATGRDRNRQIGGHKA